MSEAKMSIMKREDGNETIKTSSNSETHTILGKESEFEGKLTFEGSVRIDGNSEAK